MTPDTEPNTPRIRAALVGLGMIVDETYRPCFEQLRDRPLFDRDTGVVEVGWVAAASRTGTRHARHAAAFPELRSYAGANAVADMLREARPDAVCVATPDDRHFEPALAALRAGCHVLMEKPSVLSLSELDTLTTTARERGVLCKVVYHKLLDPDHKKLRTHVLNGVLHHVNSGYCTLLEPKSIATGQFAEWVTGRNPGTYVAVHYFKLIDFTFGDYWRLNRIIATGQRGIAGPAGGPTWDSVQTRVIYTHRDGREAAFDVHTSWVNPDNFPGYVDQEVQFRFDNGVWNAHQRKRGVEVTVEGRTPGEVKYTPNHHYNGSFVEPWGEPSRRGYGLEVIRRFFEEVAHVEHGGSPGARPDRLAEVVALRYNDVSADRNTVAIVQAMEAILAEAAAGRPDAVVRVNGPGGGLVLLRPGDPVPTVLYRPEV